MTRSTGILAGIISFTMMMLYGFAQFDQPGRVHFEPLSMAKAETSDAQAASADGFAPEQQNKLGAFIRRYLVENPDVLRDALRALERDETARQRAELGAKIAAHQPTLFNPETDFVLGNLDGDVTLIEFFDYNCGFCKRALSDLERLLAEDKALRVVLKEFPVLSESSVEVARLSMAAIEQGKYWAFHRSMMKSNGRMDRARALQLAERAGLDSEKLGARAQEAFVDQGLKDTLALAQELGINGTPSYIVGDKLIIGAVGYDELREAILDVRQRRSNRAN